MRRYSRLVPKNGGIRRVCDMLDACGWVDDDPTPDPAIELPYWSPRHAYCGPPDGYVTEIGHRHDPSKQPDKLWIIVGKMVHTHACGTVRNEIYVPQGDDTQILASLRGLLLQWEASLRARDEQMVAEAMQYNQAQTTQRVSQYRARQKAILADLSARTDLSPAEQVMLEQWRDKYRRYQIQQRECVRRYQARQKAALDALSARTDLSPAEQVMLEQLREKAARKRQQNRERVRMWRRGKG